MTDRSESSTRHERKLYGERWNGVYGGYFSDPGTASPLVERIAMAVREGSPSVVADLGGGTGFILSELASRLEARERAGVRLVCVDSAFEQLEDCRTPLDTLQCPVEQLERWMLVEGDEKLLLCMRSVLHYFGEDGMAECVKGLRGVLEPGESLVHQNICFEDGADQEIANLVYELMGTGKWYPSVEELEACLRANGFEVVEVTGAATLPITDEELEVRYEVSRDTMEDIALELERRCRGRHTVYRPGDGGFTLHLDYKVMTCIAR